MSCILVATDLSTRSDRALRRAVLLAGAHNATLTLGHVIDDDRPAYLVESERNATSTLLDETARTVTQTDQVTADVAITTGEASAGILQIADDINADIVVLGSHRRQLLDGFVGTTAERIIRRSQRPVLMANAMPLSLYQRSLLAVDFDDASRTAIDCAQRFGILERTQVTALHLFDAPASGMMKRAMQMPEAIDNYLGSQKSEARNKLDSFLSAIELRSAHRLVEHDRGSAARMILTCAEEQGADLIVMGTNQRKGVGRLLLGSVAQNVLLDAECDVLVVPVSMEVTDPAEAR